MKIIVADKMGIVAEAIKTGLRGRKGDPVEIVVARDWRSLENAIRDSGKVLVLSAQLIQGFPSIPELARSVKRLNPEAVFWVYNGVSVVNCRQVDLVLPPSNGGLVSATVIPFLEVFLSGEATGQLALF